MGVYDSGLNLRFVRVYNYLFHWNWQRFSSFLVATKSGHLSAFRIYSEKPRLLDFSDFSWTLAWRLAWSKSSLSRSCQFLMCFSITGLGLEVSSKPLALASRGLYPLSYRLGLSPQALSLLFEPIGSNNTSRSFHSLDLRKYYEKLVRYGMV